MLTACQLTPSEYPNRPPFLRAFVAWRAFIAVGLLLCVLSGPANAQERRTAVTFGGGSTNLFNEGRFGMLVQWSDHVASFGELILGGGSTHINPTPAVLFNLDHCCKIGFKLGPDIVINADLTNTEDKITYIKAATGVFFWADFAEKATVILAIDAVPALPDRPTMQASAIIALWLH